MDGVDVGASDLHHLLEDEFGLRFFTLEPSSYVGGVEDGDVDLYVVAAAVDIVVDCVEYGYIFDHGVDNAVSVDKLFVAECFDVGGGDNAVVCLYHVAYSVAVGRGVLVGPGWGRRLCVRILG